MATTRVSTSSTRIECNRLNSHAHEFVALDQAGDVIDLSDYTVSLRLIAPNGTVTTLDSSNGLDVTAPTAGKVLLHWAAGEVPVGVGSYKGELVLVKTGYRYTSASFPRLVIT